MDESNQGFMKHLGGLELKKISDTQYEFTVEIKEIHLNTGKIAHGGFLSTIADTGMGTAAQRVAGFTSMPHRELPDLDAEHFSNGKIQTKCTVCRDAVESPLLLPNEVLPK